MTQTATAPPTIHVVQIRDHMAGKRYGNGTCGAGGRTTWLGKGTETGHVVQGEGPAPQQKTRVKNPGYGVRNIIP